MMTLAVLLVIAAMLVVFFIGGLLIVLFGGTGLIFALLDLLVGGWIILIPIKCIQKKKKNKEAKE